MTKYAEFSPMGIKLVALSQGWIKVAFWSEERHLPRGTYSWTVILQLTIRKETAF